MRSIKALRVVLLLLIGTLVAGCGGSDSDTAGSSPAPANAPVAEGAQLVGSWYRTSSQVDLLGLEFTPDGKVLLYGPGGETLTFDYSIMDGGRLRMSAPQGQTMLFDCKVSADLLQLTPQGQALIDKAEFRHLPAGKTIAQAHQDEVAALQRQREQDLAAIQQILKQPKLVIVNAGAKTGPTGVALALGSGPATYQGQAYFKGADTAVLRQVSASIQPASAQSAAGVVLAYGNVLGPIGQGNLPPQNALLTLDHSGGAPVLSNASITLKSDPATYDAILENYQSVQARREAKIDEAIAPLGAYTHAQGEFAYPNNPKTSFKVDFGLLRIAGTRQFRAANLRNKPNPAVADFNQPAEVQWRDDGIWIICPSMQIAMRPIHGEDGKWALTGQFGSYQLPLVPMVQILSVDELKTIQGRVQDFMSRQLTSGVTMTGYMLKNNKSDLPCPVAFSFQRTGDTLAGVINVLHMDGSYDLQAEPVPTLAGVLLPYKSTGVRKHGPSTLFGHDRSGTISLDFTHDIPTITADLHGGFEVGPAFLALNTPGALAEQRKTLDGVLKSGATFDCVDPIQPRRQAPRMTLIESEGGELKGEISQGFSFAIHPGTVSGKLKAQDGMLVLDLTQPISADRRIPGAHHVLWALRDAEGRLWLSGWTLSTNINPPTVTSAKFLLAQQ